MVEWVEGAPTGSGALDGLTFAAKEIFELSGAARRTGTPIMLPGPAAEDSVAVARLRAAGARLTTRSTSHEFAWGITNRRADGSGTDNPLLPGRISGGSSGGSAALVAAGAVDLGLGSDTAGSCRIPAAFCGIFGWKATNGSVPLDGCLPLAPEFDCGGLMAKSPDALRAGAAVLIGSNRSIDAPQPVGTRTAVLPPDAWRIADPERRAALDAIATPFGALVADGLPGPAELFGVFGVLQGQDVLAAHRALGLWPDRSDEYPAFVRERLLAAQARSDDQLSAARRVRETAIAACERLWQHADVLMSVLPCGPTPASSPDTVLLPDGGLIPLREALVPWTCLANLVGSPAVVAPIGVDATGAPITVHLMSAPGTDLALIEQLVEWFGEGFGS